MSWVRAVSSSKAMLFLLPMVYSTPQMMTARISSQIMTLRDFFFFMFIIPPVVFAPSICRLCELHMNEC